MCYKVVGEHAIVGLVFEGVEERARVVVRAMKHGSLVGTSFHEGNSKELWTSRVVSRLRQQHKPAIFNTASKPIHFWAKSNKYKWKG